MIDVLRSTAVPESLVAGARHDGEDVVAGLYRDFLGKCYLCETNVEPGTFTIDHRKPKAAGQFPELRCTWTNLFPTCNTHRCNERRTKHYPEGGLLDPAGGDRVEERLVQRLEGPSAVLASSASRLSFEAMTPEDLPAVNTALELDRIHNGTGSSSPARRTAKALRATILQQVELIAAKLARLEGAMSLDPTEIESLTSELRKLLSRRAPYTILMRSCFAHRPTARDLFD